MFGRHQKWDDIMSYLDKIVDQHGGQIFDYRCDKWWDCGQAICAEAYGPDWMKNPVFRKWDQMSDEEAPEPHYYDCARKMAAGYIPEWMQESRGINTQYEAKGE